MYAKLINNAPHLCFTFDADYQIKSIINYWNNTTIDFEQDKLWDWLPEELHPEIESFIRQDFQAKNTFTTNYALVYADDQKLMMRAIIEKQSENEDILAPTFKLRLEILNHSDLENLQKFGLNLTPHFDINTQEWNNIIFHKANLGICIFDEQGFIVKVNEVYCSLVGYSESELLNNNIHLVFDSELLENIKEKFKILLSNNKEVQIEGQIKKKDHSYLDISLKINSYLHTSGNLFIISYIQDITEHKKKEKILSHTRKVTKIGIWELDVLTGYNTWTEEIYQIYEVSPDFEVSIEKGLSFYTPESQKILNQAIQKAIEKGQSFDLDLELISANQTSKKVRATCEPISVNNQTIKLLGTFQDITPQIRFEKEVQLLALVAKKVTNGVIITNALGQVEWINEGFVELSGYTLSELQGKKPGEILQGPDTNKNVKQRIHQLLKQRKLVEEEILNYHKNGTSYWINLQITPIFNEQGKLTNFIGVQTNIHQRKLAELKLKENETHFNSLVNNVPIMIWEADLHQKRTYFNQIWLDFVGSTPAQEIGDGWMKQVHPEDLQAYLQAYQNGYAKRERFLIEYRLRRYDGEYRWILAQGSPWYDKNGAFIGFIGACIDKTDLRQAEDKIAFQANILQNVSDSVIVTDLQGNIVFYNEGSKNTFGYTAQEMLGQTPQVLYPNYNTNTFTHEFVSILDGMDYNDIWKGKHKNGKEIWVDITTTLFKNQKGENIGIIGIAKDITDRKIIEYLLEETSRIGNIGGWELNLETQQLTWTSQTYRIHEIPIGKKINVDSAINFYHPDYRPIIREAVKDLIKYQKEYDLELLLTTATGKNIWIRTKGTHETVNGKTVKIKGIFQNIHYQKSVFLANEEYIKLISLSSELFAIIDFEGKFCQVNPAWEKVLGYTEQELLGKSFMEFIHPDDQAISAAEEKRLLSSFENDRSESINFINRNIHKNGQVKFLAWNATAILSRKKIYCSASDITEIILQQKKIQENEAHLRAIFDATIQQIFLLDANFNLIRCNRAAQEYIQTTFNLEVLLGKSIFEYIHNQPKLHEKLIRAFKDEIVIYTEELTMSSNQKKWFEIECLPVYDDKNEIFGVVLTYLDINEQKVVENALKKSQADYENLIQMIPTGVFKYAKLSNGEQKFLYVSPAWCKAKQIVEQAILANPHLAYDIVHPADRVLFIQLHQESIIQEKDFYWEGRTVVDGKIRYVHIESKVQKMEDGTALWHGIDYDITAKKEAELKIAESEANLRAIFECSEECYFLINEQFELLKFNNSADKMIKKIYEYEISVGENINLVFKTKLLYEVKKYLELAFANQIHALEFNVNDYWYQFSFRPVVNDKGQVFAVAVFSLDITHKKYAEINLMKSYTELHNFQKALNASALTSVTNLEGEIIRVNKAFCKASGYIPRELIGKNHHILNSAYHSPSFFENMWHTISQGDYWRGEIRNVSKSGEIFWFDTLICPIKDEFGKVIEYLSINYLITERKKAEETREKLIEQLKDFAFMTSHNLRRPLANIMGLISIFDYENVKSEFNLIVLENLQKSTIELDNIVHKMNNILERDITGMSDG